jgi:hypothetical protein
VAYSQPSVTNVFIPNHAATGGLLAGFSRNPKAFAFNRYVQIYPVPKMLGYYATWLSRQAARIHHSDLRDFMWRDGNDAPHGADNLESFTYVKYETQRYAFPFTLGDLTIAQADWPILQAHSEVVAQQAMTGRTALAYAKWNTASLWGTHCANVDGTYGTLNGNAAILLAGQNWTNGSGTAPYIQKSLNYGTVFINRDTLAVLGMKDTILVVNPNTALQMAQSPEIHAYFQGSPFAQAQIRGDQPSLNDRWGLPDILYGHPFVVEDAVIDTNLRNETPTASNDGTTYVVADGVALLTSRVGGLEGVGGSPAHSTLVMWYMQDDLTVMSYHDQNNLLTRGRVVSNFSCDIVQYNAGFLYNHCLG